MLLFFLFIFFKLSFSHDGSVSIALLREKICTASILRKDDLMSLKEIKEIKTSTRLYLRKVKHFDRLFFACALTGIVGLFSSQYLLSKKLKFPLSILSCSWLIIPLYRGYKLQSLINNLIEDLEKEENLIDHVEKQKENNQLEEEKSIEQTTEEKEKFNEENLIDHVEFLSEFEKYDLNHMHSTKYKDLVDIYFDVGKMTVEEIVIALNIIKEKYFEKNHVACFAEAMVYTLLNNRGSEGIIKFRNILERVNFVVLLDIICLSDYNLFLQFPSCSVKNCPFTPSLFKINFQTYKNRMHRLYHEKNYLDISFQMVNFFNQLYPNLNRGERKELVKSMDYLWFTDIVWKRETPYCKDFAGFLLETYSELSSEQLGFLFYHCKDYPLLKEIFGLLSNEKKTAAFKKFYPRPNLMVQFFANLQMSRRDIFQILYNKPHQNEILNIGDVPFFICLLDGLNIMQKTTLIFKKFKVESIVNIFDWLCLNERMNEVKSIMKCALNQIFWHKCIPMLKYANKLRERGFTFYEESGLANFVSANFDVIPETIYKEKALKVFLKFEDKMKETLGAVEIKDFF